MARRSKLALETPESSAPNDWQGINAQHWQSHGGKWAAPQHYMCTYMAMFPPELPHYFIQRFTKVGDKVLDPFSGRGTTAVEASAQGRIGIGNDLNPLAVALSRGKISNPTLDEVISRLDYLKSHYNSEEWSPFNEPDKIRMIYHKKTLSQLCYLKENLDWSKQGVDAFIVSVIMGAMHGQSSGFLSVSMPNTFSMGWNYVKKYIREKNLECPERDVFEVVEKRVRRYLKKGYLVGSGKIIEGDVRNLDNELEHDSIQLLFTSPPYLKVIKYGLYNWIRLWFLTESGSHEEVDAKLDDTHALKDYLDFIKDSLSATLPLLDRERGLSCWAIGDVKDLNLAWIVWHHVGKNIEIKTNEGEILRYKLIAIVDDEIPDNQKVTKIWKTKKWVINRVEEGISEVLFEFDSAKEAESSFKIISECQEIGRTIQRNYPESIDGREAIKWMRSVDSSHWRKMEWPGHYLEEFGGQMLDEEYGEATIPKYGNTEFDRLIKNIIIDFKNHNLHNPKGKDNPTAIMNDANAIRCGLKEHPMAFLVVCGNSKFDDDGSFKTWHDSIKGKPSRYVQEGKRTGRPSRTRKIDFTVAEMKMILFRNEGELDNAIGQGWISQHTQGKNSNGKPRPDKFHIELDKIPSNCYVELDSRIDYNLIENVSDKSGKATPLDRILIIAPETANPQPILDVEEISWMPFQNPKLSDF